MMPPRALLIAILALIGATAQVAAQKQVDRRIPTVPDAYLRIFQLTGSVRVEGWDKDSVWVRGTAFEAPGEPFSITPGPKGVKIMLWGEDETKVRPSQLTIYVPRKAMVWVKTQSATAFVSGVQGGVDINTVSGDITAEGDPRELYVESMGGKINLNVRTRSVRAKSGTGDITALVVAEEVLLSTVGGKITVTGSRTSQATIESIDGDISYYGDVGWPGRLKIRNHSGNIDIGIGPNVAAQFTIETIQGEIRDEYGIKSRIMESKLGRVLDVQLGSTVLLEARIDNFKGTTTLRKAVMKKVAG
jgi:hypothetical protein